MAGGLPRTMADTVRSLVKLRIEEKVLDSTGDSFYATCTITKKRLYTADGSKSEDVHKLQKNAADEPLLQMTCTRWPIWTATRCCT